jgi:SPP1 gp7 family putative phage head morphogenesis protein
MALASESRYNSQLRAVAKQVGVLVKGLAPEGSLRNAQRLIDALNQYATYIEPWANAVAAFMLADVARKDGAMWKRHSKDMAIALRRELLNAPTGHILRQLQGEQVELIQSIPTAAADRIQGFALEATITGKRATEIAKEVLASEHVSAAKAALIARTEVARAASNLVQARAVYAGSDGYIWRTSGDANVRPSHEEMEGKYVRWSSPPTLDNLKGHAGCLPNCRCFAEPIFPDD